MLRKERNSVSDLKAHLVCVTKYRKNVLTAEGLKLIKQDLRSTTIYGV